jgi:tRNA(Ile2) C34 agmatinyltransferase TiaS
MRIRINNNQLKTILESISKSKIICDNCGWSWKKSDGGEDPFTCHKCGHINIEKNAVTKTS